MGDEMTREEQLAAALFSVEKTWVATTKIAGFVAGAMPDEHEIVAEARKAADAMDRLRGLLRAKNPPPWNFYDESEAARVS